MPERNLVMGYLIGVALAAAVGLVATIVGLDRDRAFYPTVTIVIASYYVLFAICGGTSATISAEIAVMSLFAGAAIAGFKCSLWFVVAALAAHGIYDFVHSTMLPHVGMPPWWPQFCLAYDVVAAGYLAVRLTRHQPKESTVVG